MRETEEEKPARLSDSMCGGLQSQEMRRFQAGGVVSRILKNTLKKQDYLRKD